MFLKNTEINYNSTNLVAPTYNFPNMRCVDFLVKILEEKYRVTDSLS